MNFVSEAIEFAKGNSAHGNDTVSWKEISDGLRRRVYALETKAIGALHSFECVADEFEGGKCRLKPNVAAPSQVVHVANNLWRRIGGRVEPARAAAVIAAACVEFTRSQFAASLTGISICAFDPSMREHVYRAAATISDEMIARPWHDADAIARAPFPSIWFDQSASFDFFEWLSEVDGHDLNAYQFREPAASMSPIPKGDELLSAIALAWMDEAIRNPVAAFAFMADVAEATESAGLLSGWDGCEEALKEDSAAEIKSFARMGAKAAHARHYELKEKVLAAYRNGNYPSKDAAAEAIAGHIVPLTFRTVRDHLKGS